MSQVPVDLRFALRSLLSRPVSTSVILLTGALAIGACTALFDLANLISWMPIPGTEPRGLVQVYTKHPQPFIGPWGYLPAADFEEYQRGSTSFSGFAGERFENAYLTPSEQGPQFAERQVNAHFVSGNYFETLGAAVPRGRALQANDDRPAADGAVVLADAFWRSHLGADPAALAASVLLGDQEMRIVGIATPPLRSTSAGSTVDLWVPLALGSRLREDFDDTPLLPSIVTFARLRPDTSIAQAEQELQRLANELDRVLPLPSSVPREITVSPARLGHPIDRKGFRPVLQMLGAAVALLLLLACANIANLLLGRAVERSKETSMRLALGATRWRLMRQLLTESLLLAFAAGGLGLLLALASRRLFGLWDLEDFATEMQLDHRVLGASLLTCGLSALLFGVVPAVAASGTRLTDALRDGRGAVRRGSLRAFQGLAVLQVALATVLLVCTALVTSSLWSLRQVDLGFDDTNLVRAGFFLGDFDYDREQSQRFLEELERRVGVLRNVESTSVSLFLPPLFLDVERQFRLPEDRETERSARFNVIDDTYFATLGMRLLAGRTFEESDAAGPPVVVINQLLAERIWPHQRAEQALGRSLLFEQRRAEDPQPEHRIVGVVQTITQRDLRSHGEPILYLPLAQRPRTSYSLVARIVGEPEAYVTALRRLVEELDPRVQPNDVQTSAELRWDALVVQRLQSQTVGMLAVIGLFLSVLGVYGVMQLTVTRRTSEIGLRMALGSSRLGILRWVLTRTLRLGSLGAVAGVVVSLYATKLLRGWVRDLGEPQPWVFAASVAVLLLTALGATLLPARRAARIQPAEVLRSE